LLVRHALFDRVVLAVDLKAEILERSLCCFKLCLAICHGIPVDISAPLMSKEMLHDIKAKVTTFDIRLCHASHPDDHGRILQVIHGSEEQVKKRIRDMITHVTTLIENVVNDLSDNRMVESRNENNTMLAEYCASHVLSHQTHVCTRAPCPHGHGDADYRILTEEDGDQPALQLNMHVVVAMTKKGLTRESYNDRFGYAICKNYDLPPKAQTFILHCWKELFTDLVNTIWKEYRGHLATVSPWICSFALPQNIDTAKIGTTLLDCPFLRRLSSPQHCRTR